MAATTTMTLIDDVGIVEPLARTRGTAGRRGNTPATTIVEECSSDDTGVGPAMASGSQVCSGNWPLLPMHAMNSATAAHSSRVWLASPDSAHPEIAWMLKPVVPRCSSAHALEPKKRMLDADEQADVADAHGEERLQRGAGVGLLLPPVADQHERAEAHDLPAEDELDRVLGEDHHEHAGGEQRHGGEEVRVAAVAADVLERVDLHQQRDERHEGEQHHRRARRSGCRCER